MSPRLDDRRRGVIAALAARILPGSDAQPAATQIAIEAAPLDRVLRARPDLETGLCALLDRYTGDAQAYLQELDAIDFDRLMTVICAAYVMDPTVRRALGYDGQQALTPNRGGFGAEELVINMMQQPKRYRRV